MGRPQRSDCDYFPFFVKQGKTFSLLRRRWPLEGIGFFTELCILLTRTPKHHIKVESDLDFEYVLGDMGCTVEKAKEIMELLTATGKVHKNLWENNRIIVIPDLLTSLEYAYEKRANKIVSVEEIELMHTETIVSGPETTVGVGFPGTFIPEVKKSKLNKNNTLCVCDGDFDTFWEAWPKKVGKKDAEKAWKKTAKTRPTIDRLIGMIEMHKASDQWKRGIIPNPATWLNGERWSDIMDVKVSDITNKKVAPGFMGNRFDT